ncbi:MAG: hypothetical protein HY554_19035 [Elusimicrobia bacterium]|nr:hypothetical protein [Elusimicrobiota bacterium]
MAAAFGLLFGPWLGRAWAKEGHEGHMGHIQQGRGSPASDNTKGKTDLEKLRERIHAIEQQLANAQLTAKKRANLQKQLKKLNGQKGRMTGARNAAGDQATYVCAMGDYSGPMTKDGRCPKCGMTLQKKQ